MVSHVQSQGKLWDHAHSQHKPAPSGGFPSLPWNTEIGKDLGEGLCGGVKLG